MTMRGSIHGKSCSFLVVDLRCNSVFRVFRNLHNSSVVVIASAVELEIVLALASEVLMAKLHKLLAACACNTPSLFMHQHIRVRNKQQVHLARHPQTPPSRQQGLSIHCIHALIRHKGVV